MLALPGQPSRLIATRLSPDPPLPPGCPGWPRLPSPPGWVPGLPGQPATSRPGGPAHQPGPSGPAGGPQSDHPEHARRLRWLRRHHGLLGKSSMVWLVISLPCPQASQQRRSPYHKKDSEYLRYQPDPALTNIHLAQVGRLGSYHQTGRQAGVISSDR